MSKMYFTSDGTYGSAETVEDLILIETDGWSQEMWDEVEGTSDGNRMWLAQHFSIGSHPIEIDENGTPKCKQCFFEPQHLNGGGER